MPWCAIDELGRGDPPRHLAGVDDALHQSADERTIPGRGQPIALPQAPLLVANQPSLGIGAHSGPGTERAVEAEARQVEAEIVSGLTDEPVPAPEASAAIPDIGGARNFVDGAAHRHVFGRHPALPIRQLDLQALISRDVVGEPLWTQS